MTQAYPLTWPEGWPRTAARERAPYARFKTSFTKARTELFAELDRLGATNAVVSSWLPLRNDGLPRADAARMKIDDPGVAVYFQWKDRSMVMARDAYTNVHDNLRSIGLGIQHLRGLERHGGGYMMERAFEGFARLASPESFDAWKVMGLSPGADRAEIEAKFRVLAREHHPDHGGDPDAFVSLTKARDRLLQTI